MSTILTSTQDREVLATTAAELEQAHQVQQQLDLDPAAEMTIRTRSEVTLRIPTELASVMSRVLSIVARGGTVTVGSMPAELTTSTAAEQIGVSRPTLMKMIERGEIPAHKIGTHTRLLSDDVMTFRQQRLERRRRAFDELRDLVDDDD